MDDKSKQLARFHHVFTCVYSADQYGERRFNGICNFVSIEFHMEFLGTCTRAELP